MLKNSYQEREGSTEVPLTDQELFRLDNRADAIRFYFVANVTDFFKLPQLKNAAGAQLASAPPPPSGANAPAQQPVQPLGEQALDKDPYQELNSIFRELENEVSCSICAEYFTSPMLLGCGHSYCSACIANWNEHCPAPIIGRGRGRGRAARPTRTIPCPICMQGITSQVANRALENISTMLPRLSTAIRDIPVHPPAPIVVTLGPPPINFRSRSRSRKVTANNTGAVPGVITLDDSSSSRSAASRSTASSDPDVIWLD